MGRHGRIRVNFAHSNEPQVQTAWEMMEKSGFFAYFQPKYLDSVDAPVAIKEDARLQPWIRDHSLVWYPDERLIPGTSLTVTQNASSCPEAIRYIDDLAPERKLGWSIGLIGNLHTVYCTAAEKRSGLVFRATRSLRGGDGRRFRWHEPSLQLYLRKQPFPGPPTLTLSVSMVSSAFMCWPDWPHPNLPPSLNRANWSCLLERIASLADGTAGVSSVQVCFQKLRGNIPSGILQEARRLPKLTSAEG
jgi:hypothetical protein